jgi:hypothetical protein
MIERPETAADILALMGKVQNDERAFVLLHARTIDLGRSGRHITFGDVLREYGDPRTWPEYQQ